MLEQTLTLARSRGARADALQRDQQVLTLTFESGRLKECAYTQEAGLNLRVFAEGRVGVAGTTDLAAAEDVVARAFASAAEGEVLDVALPAARPVPAAESRDARVEALDVTALAELGRGVVERLVRPGWQVSATVERFVESASFANTVGQAYTWLSTAVSVSAQVTRVALDGVLMAGDATSSVGVPGDAELGRVAREILTRMERAERVVPAPEGRLPVLFTPQGSAAVLMPLRQALSGKSVLQGISPLGGKLGETLFDARLTVVDDPLAPGRLGTRPGDDEGVPSARLALIEGGVLRAFAYDLETAARAGVPSTGHGQRTTFGKPAIQFSNLLVTPGDLEESALLAAVGDGMVVEDLIGVGQGNVASGAFSHPVALGYRVERGEITGRVKEAAVAGNAFELLKSVRAIGSEARWINGSRLVPPVVVEGVRVSG